MPGRHKLPHVTKLSNQRRETPSLLLLWSAPLQSPSELLWLYQRRWSALDSRAMGQLAPHAYCCVHATIISKDPPIEIVQEPISHCSRVITFALHTIVSSSS